MKGVASKAAVRTLRRAAGSIERVPREYERRRRRLSQECLRSCPMAACQVSLLCARVSPEACLPFEAGHFWTAPVLALSPGRLGLH